MTKYKLPQRLVLSKDTEKVDELFIEKPLQADFNHDNCAKIKQGGFVLLDFGREIRGGIAFVVQLISKKSGTAKCRLVFGESVSEAMSSIGEKNAANDHSVRDMTVDVPMMSTNRYGATGFRFVKIEAVDSDICIKTAVASLDIKELEYKGSFECDDELLNKIWQTGAYTVHLNMGEFMWDGIKRDRLVWIGDMHPETRTVSAVFGYDDCIEKSLDFAISSTPPDKWLNGIATYSMWWIINQYDWYMQQGNRQYLENQLDYLDALINRTVNWIDSEYKADDAFETFVDWPDKGEECEIEGVKSILCLGLEAASKIFCVFGKSDKSALCKKYAGKLKSEASDVPLNKRIAGINVLADRCLEKSKNALKGNSAEEMSCFMGFYTLLAKAKMGETSDALDIIREYWGGMLKMGATTFWEDFDVKWTENSFRIDEPPKENMHDIHGDFGKHCYLQFRHSLCHGWASGPTAFLSGHVLGVNIEEAGCKRVRISPHLGNLSYVKGSYPTPFGEIHIEHKSENGKITTRYTAPKEIEIIVDTDE